MKSISSHMLLILRRATIANGKRLDIETRDHGGWPISGANPGVDRVVSIEEATIEMHDPNVTRFMESDHSMGGQRCMI